MTETVNGALIELAKELFAVREERKANWAGANDQKVASELKKRERRIISDICDLMEGEAE